MNTLSNIAPKVVEMLEKRFLCWLRSIEWEATIINFVRTSVTYQNDYTGENVTQFFLLG